MERELIWKVREKLNKLFEVIAFIYENGKNQDDNYMIYIKNLNTISEYCLEYTTFDIIDKIYDYYDILKSMETNKYVYHNLTMFLEQLPSFGLSESNSRK